MNKSFHLLQYKTIRIPIYLNKLSECAVGGCRQEFPTEECHRGEVNFYDRWKKRCCGCPYSSVELWEDLKWVKNFCFY